MEGFSSNLNDTFTSTRGCAEPMFFPQHILPLLPLYNAQWWGYKSAIVLVDNVNSGLTLDEISFIIMFFADDMVIFGKDFMDLQNLTCCT